MRILPICVQRGLREYVAIRPRSNDRIRYQATLENDRVSLVVPTIKVDGRLIAVVPVTTERFRLSITERHSGKRVFRIDTKQVDFLAKANRVIPEKLTPSDSILAVDAQNPLHRGQYDLNLDDCFDTYDGDIVWRIAVDWKGSLKSKPQLKLVDKDLELMDVPIHEFEFQKGLFREGRRVNRVIATFRIPKDKSDFCLFASDPQREVMTNFFPMDSLAAVSAIEERTERMQSIKDQQARYAEWADEHLKTLGDSELIDDATAENDLHVVICATGHFQSDIERSLESLEHQKRAAWRATVLTDGTSTAAQMCERANTISANGAREITVTVHSIAERARAAHVCIIEAGDTFAQGALIKIAEAASNPRNVILFDEDSIDADGTHTHPRFKSELNKQLTYTENWVGYGAAFPAELVADTTMNGDITSPSLIAYALTLAAIREQLPFEHIPAVLLHTPLTSWENRDARNGAFLPEEIDAAKKLLSDHLVAIGAHAVAEDGLLDGTLRIGLSDDAEPGKVSIIIPTMDHGDMLNQCVSSILNKATYKNIEIILVENNSKEDETFALYDRLQKENPGVVKVVTWDGPFNYSAIINFGVAASNGKFLLLLNNDTEVIVPSFIEEMLALATIPEVGVVGAKLYFKDMLIQHAGMLIGPYSGISHVNQNFSDIRPGYQNRALTTSSFSSVTGACQMVRREVFDEVGGYDDTLVVGFNDADFCLKVRAAGYDVVFTPYAELYHFEFVSRGREAVDDEKQVRWENERDTFFSKWEDALKEGDPLANPNFDKDNWYYALPENEA